MPFFRMFRRELIGRVKAVDGAGASKVAEPAAFYGMDEEQIDRLVDLTQKVFLVVERELKLTGFWESIPARYKLKAEIQNVLLSPEFASFPDLVRNRAPIISRIMEIAEKNNDIILYAE